MHQLRFVTFSSVVAFAIFLVPPSSAVAEIVIDQIQPRTPFAMARFVQTGLAQSFKPSYDNVTGASIFLKYVARPQTSDVTISLFDNLPTAGGSLLASGTARGVSTNGDARVDFGQIPVIAEATYYLVFTGSNPDVSIAGEAGNVYARGELFANDYEAFPDYDFAFRTYSDAVTPEPGALALYAMGGLFFLLARRKNPSARRRAE